MKKIRHLLLKYTSYVCSLFPISCKVKWTGYVSGQTDRQCNRNVQEWIVIARLGKYTKYTAIHRWLKESYWQPIDANCPRSRWSVLLGRSPHSAVNGDMFMTILNRKSRWHLHNNEKNILWIVIYYKYITIHKISTHFHKLWYSFKETIPC